MIEPCPPQVTRLIRRLEQVASEADIPSLCQAVKNVLVEELGTHRVTVPEKFLEPVPDGYARRCLFKDPEGRFTVVAMVWAAGQSTPLHDHAGSWCVECVYQGRIRVESYEMTEEQNGRARFKGVGTIDAGIGGAGALIPPFEYHTLANPFEETAVTVHVYQGELTWCHSFEPTDDPEWFTRERHDLVYNG